MWIFLGGGKTESRNQPCNNHTHERCCFRSWRRQARMEHSVDGSHCYKTHLPPGNNQAVGLYADDSSYRKRKLRTAFKFSWNHKIWNSQAKCERGTHTWRHHTSCFKTVFCERGNKRLGAGFIVGTEAHGADVTLRMPTKAQRGKVERTITFIHGVRKTRFLYI